MTEFMGLKALVVEDEGAIALMIEDILIDLGCEITASAARLDKACELARTVEIDFALLDLNLDGKSAVPVAHILRERQIPFVFCTGYGTSGLTDEFRAYPMLIKPFDTHDLRQKLVRALQPG